MPNSALHNCARRFVLCLFLVVAAACGATQSQSRPQTITLTISAASDLIPAFEAVGAQFRAEYGIGVTFNFGSSGQLAHQIEQGAPVDVFASANRAYIDDLDRLGLVLSDTIALYAVGRLTLWTRADSALRYTRMEDLAQDAVRRVAIANPEHAPYGVAAREALISAGLWEALQSKLIIGENVAQTLQYAEMGNADVALVALSLSIAAGDTGRYVLVPAELHKPLEQALAVIKNTPHEAEARQFVQYVNSEAARAIMRRYGFFLPGEASSP